MIDLHTHVLPGLDDGPAELSESLAMLAAAEEDGVEVMAATPHARDDHPGVELEQIPYRCAELEQARGPLTGPAVVPGAEVDLAWAMAASEDQLRLASLGQRGSVLLVETPYGPLPGPLEAALFRLATLGFRLLLAHPERNPSFQDDHRRLEDLVHRGVLVQVTAASIVSGRRSRRLALQLLDDGLAHVIASDAHASAGQRGPRLSEAVAAVERLHPGRGRWMVDDVPRALLAGENPPPPPAPRTRGRLARLRRRG